MWPDPASLITLRAFALSSAASTVEAVARSDSSHCGGHLARHAELGDVRGEGGMEGGGDADEDERAEA
eukprot:scaffold112676_cov57-Phaeocystis_antarctica.AAC.1